MGTVKAFYYKYFSYEKNIRIILIILIGISVFMRFYLINSIPPDLEVDGSIHGIHALKISDNINLDTLFPKVTCYLWLYAPWHILLGILFKIFSASRLTIVTTSAIISIITALSIFLYGKRLFGITASLISVFIALASLWYITYSRYALGFITVIPILYTLTLYNLFLYDEEKNFKYLIYAGLLLGAGWLNGYPHILSILPIYIVYKTWREYNLWWIFTWRVLLFIFVGLSVYIIGAILIAEVLNGNSIWAIPHAQKTFFMNYKIKDSGILKVNTLLPILLMIKKNSFILLKEYFVGTYERLNPAFMCLKVTGYPLISPVISIFFILGIIRSLWNRKSIDKLLLVWIFFPLMAYLLLVQKVCTRYFLGIFPAVCLVAGREIEHTFLRIFKRFPVYMRGIIPMVLILFIIGIPSLYSLYHGYFGYYAKNDCFLNCYYGMEKAAKYIEGQIGSDQNSLIVFEDDVLVPNFAFHFYTKGKYRSRAYLWDEFMKLYRKKEINVNNKNIAFIFSNPDDSHIKFLGRDSRFDDFRGCFRVGRPSIVVNHNDGTVAKFVYILKG